MAVTKHTQYHAGIATILSTEMNSLANNANTAASSAIDNSSNCYLYDDLTLTIATQGSARTAQTVIVYMVQALDGSVYDDTHQDTAEVVATFTLDLATTARQLTRRDVPIPPGLFKYFVRNQTGQALASSGNLLERRPHSIDTT